jgi:protein-tyrosine phosphatase
MGGPDLTWLTDGLAVGGSYPSSCCPLLVREHRVNAVVDLRAEACDDELELARHGIELLHLPTPDLGPLVAAQLERGVAFVGDRLARGRRVLVHCEHGIGRSATLALCVLVAGGMPPLAALELTKQRRRRVSPSPAQYECWAAWLRRRDIAVPDFADFALIAYGEAE